MPAEPDEIIDCHMHVSVLGDTEEWRKYGRLSLDYRKGITFQVFLKYLGIRPDQVNDDTIQKAILRVIDSKEVGSVVCLALDPVYDRNCVPHPEASNVWVANEYILDLKEKRPDKVRYGASVHPFAADFEARVAKAVEGGAVLLKWVPSAQQFSLGDPKVGEALEILGKARRDSKPLPLLLHCGPEYAIPTTVKRMWTYDFLSWNVLDRAKNIFGTWFSPDIQGTDRNLRRGLDAGAIIILAHCGLPYFSSGFLGNLLEHSDFERVRAWLESNAGAPYPGRCYADVSALCTPMRKTSFPDVAKLPPEYLLLGSDFPTPSFELFPDAAAVASDFKAVMKGDIERLVIPQVNLLDFNYRQLQKAFPEHPMFTNFARKLRQA
jgi:hypothetical protein